MRAKSLSFNLYLELSIISKTREGKETRILVYSQQSKSFLKAWSQKRRATWGNTSETIKATDGTSGTVSSTGQRIDAGAGVISFGIVIGSGNTPVVIDDYKLESQFSHGTGANQFLYKVAEFDAHQVVGNVASFKSKRQFENQSGSTITIKEIGIYEYYNGTKYHCVVRDVLTTPQDVLNGQIAEVRYTLKTTA